MSWVLTWGRKGARAQAQARPRVLATSRSLCHPSVMQRAYIGSLHCRLSLRRFRPLQTLADLHHEPQRFPLACVAQASPMSRRVALGLDVRRRSPRAGEAQPEFSLPLSLFCSSFRTHLL